MASLVEFQKKKMFRFFSDYKAEIVDNESGDKTSATFYSGSVFPVKSEGSLEVVIEIGGKYEFAIPKSFGIVGEPKVIFLE